MNIFEKISQCRKIYREKQNTKKVKSEEAFVGNPVLDIGACYGKGEYCLPEQRNFLQAEDIQNLFADKASSGVSMAGEPVLQEYKYNNFKPAIPVWRFAVENAEGKKYDMAVAVFSHPDYDNHNLVFAAGRNQMKGQDLERNTMVEDANNIQRFDLRPKENNDPDIWSVTRFEGITKVYEFQGNGLKFAGRYKAEYEEVVDSVGNGGCRPITEKKFIPAAPIQPVKTNQNQGKI